MGARFFEEAAGDKLYGPDFEGFEGWPQEGSPDMAVTIFISPRLIMCVFLVFWNDFIKQALKIA